ncbi:Arc family DNA-binding protein [Sinorhizobium meliloti]|uniref:Arc family DNA-binding protein n=1 Tax=Rhizobium meliloti TaxID=382 RepID=UPI000FDA70CB|nr:Arc family DNA-binding protein [Sinorhizobium meliloti]RVH28180.1 Arc family DNA-binding protein [Sinorhizobium meliloti]RVQ41677.1 Arc family DNA-binding protein [Sinorhizobium meliloti]
MAKQGRGSEQVMIRLPDGMRDRIRVAAEKHGRSMNAEIVAALEVHFPEPFSFGKRVADLLVLARGLKQLPTTASVDALIQELETTIEGIAHGQAPELGEEVRSQIDEALHEWRMHKASDYSARVYKWMDDAGEKWEDHLPQSPDEEGRE